MNSQFSSTLHLKLSRPLCAAATAIVLTTSVFSADVLDRDNDGMSDVWQRVYGIAAGDTASDPDQDGHDNAQEARAGTNPHSIASRLQTIAFTLNTTATTATLTWKSENGKNYDIEYSPDLVAWTHSSYVTGDGSNKTATTTLAAEAKKFYRIRARQTEDDSDDDTLTNWEENLLGTSRTTADTDGDGMDDDKEFISQLNPLVDDAFSDPDGDGIPNLGEVLFGFDPHSAATTPGVPDTSVFPWASDADSDGLTNQQELLVTLTHPKNDDTDYDGMSDGWEVANTLNPKNGAGVDGPTGDPDGDGLINIDEFNHSTSAVNPDTDGDGVNDATEVNQGSNPNDRNDSQPPPPGTVPVNITFGDGSSSHSEKYKFILTPVEGPDTQVHSRSNSGFGIVDTRTMRLWKGCKYALTMTHVGSSPKYRGKPKPDYDYTLAVGATACVLVEDPYAAAPPAHGMLGGHLNDEAPHPDGTFWASGKTAYVSILDIETQTLATLPIDRKRRKVGVGEKVILTLKPTMTAAIAWTIAGDGVLSSTSGQTTQLTAHERASTPTITATVSGVACSVPFTVVEPSSVTMEKESGTGIWHVNGKASVGFKGRAFIHPDDVSFINVDLREGMCVGVGTGFLVTKNGEVHPNGGWIGIVAGTAAQPNKDGGVDTISTGTYPPPFGQSGAFTWPIPWLFRANAGLEKQFTVVTHQENVDAAGGATISKGGHSESTSASDPTSNY